MPLSLTGTYKLISSENYNEYLTALGVNKIVRGLACTAKPTIEITKEGDEWTIKTSSTIKTTEIKFKLGQEFDETTDDGRVCKSVITQEGENKLVHVQNCANVQPLTILREFTKFTKTQMKMTLEAPGGIFSTRKFQKE